MLLALASKPFGEVAEWSIALDLKSSVPRGTVGSNPTLSVYISSITRWFERLYWLQQAQFCMAKLLYFLQKSAQYWLRIWLKISVDIGRSSGDHFWGLITHFDHYWKLCIKRVSHSFDHTALGNGEGGDRG